MAMAADTPALIGVSETERGFRFRFRLRAKVLIVDTDPGGRPLDVHVEYPPEYGWPSPRVERVARDVIRRAFLFRSITDVMTYG